MSLFGTRAQDICSCLPCKHSSLTHKTKNIEDNRTNNCQECLFSMVGLGIAFPSAQRSQITQSLSKAINLASAAALAGLLPSTAHAQANGYTFDRGESPRLLLKSALWPAQRYCTGGRAFQCHKNVLRPRYLPAGDRHHAS